MKTFLCLFILILFSSCMQIPADVQESLTLAGSNQKELKKVLRRFSWHKKDSLKFKAACFLITNMRWHTTDSVTSNTDPRFRIFYQKVDSIYCSLYKGKDLSADSLEKHLNTLKSEYNWLADSIRKCKFKPSEVCIKTSSDLQVTGSNFLINHIENAFRQWNSSPFSNRLDYEEFCEYILPYRSIKGHSSNYSGHELNRMFGKHINYKDTESSEEHILRYNTAIRFFRHFLGERTKENAGIYNLLYQGHECSDIAGNGCNILRSCGIPATIEFCDAYRDFPGRHFYCITPDSNGIWKTFNPESSLPGEGKWVAGAPMNLYRQYFGAQKDSPFFQKNTDEHLPSLFNNPCLKEITSERAEVCRVTLPFTEKTTNHLAYLAAFQVTEQVVPVTWGRINKEKKEITFENTMTGRLYFPIYYERTMIKSFGTPFYVKKDSTDTKGYSIHYFPTDTRKRRDFIITRKFPRKTNMIKIADNLVGSTFTGANKRDFSDAKIIGTITTSPGPYLEDVIIKNPQAYQYYRFTAPDEHPQANISMLEFLTNKSYGYKNSLPPTPQAILSPEDTNKLAENSQMVKLLDEPSWDKMNWKAEYDGNMQTAPAGYNTVTLWLKTPQIVKRIRFAPKNADNGIKPGEKYQLLYWDNGWQSCGVQTAKYEYLKYTNIPDKGILWLQNLTSGKEELPFIIKNGKQLFFYYDIVKSDN